MKVDREQYYSARMGELASQFESFLDFCSTTTTEDPEAIRLRNAYLAAAKALGEEIEREPDYQNSDWNRLAKSSGMVACIESALYRMS